MRPISRRFVDPELEQAFDRENFETSAGKVVRFSIPLVTVAFLLYGIHDALLVPEALRNVYIVRFGFFAPLAALTCLFVYLNRSPKLHQWVMLAFSLVINGSVLAIGALAKTPAGFFIYTSYAVVFVTLGPFIAQMNVRMQALYTIFSVILYDLLDMNLVHAPGVVRLSMNLAIFTLGTIGALSARRIEAEARRAFLQRRTIRAQMEALDRERRKSESLLLNILPARIAARLKDETNVIADEFASASVLFCDIVGFTELSARLKPEELVRGLNSIFSRFDELADTFGLEKIKTIGDAYMVAGGIPMHSDDHAVRVCQMALAMRDGLRHLSLAPGSELRVRIGIHTGPVVAGVIGKRKFIYDVWGDTVNTASRMESHGIQGAIHVSAATYEAARERFTFEPRGAMEIKGKGSMQTYLLIAPIQNETRTPMSNVP